MSAGMISFFFFFIFGVWSGVIFFRDVLGSENDGLAAGARFFFFLPFEKNVPLDWTRIRITLHLRERKRKK